MRECLRARGRMHAPPAPAPAVRPRQAAQVPTKCPGNAAAHPLKPREYRAWQHPCKTLDTLDTLDTSRPYVIGRWHAIPATAPHTGRTRTTATTQARITPPLHGQRSAFQALPLLGKNHNHGSVRGITKPWVHVTKKPRRAQGGMGRSRQKAPGRLLVTLLRDLHRNWSKPTTPPSTATPAAVHSAWPYPVDFLPLGLLSPAARPILGSGSPARPSTRSIQAQRPHQIGHRHNRNPGAPPNQALPPQANLASNSLSTAVSTRRRCPAWANRRFSSSPVGVQRAPARVGKRLGKTAHATPTHSRLDLDGALAPANNRRSPVPSRR